MSSVLALTTGASVGVVLTTFGFGFRHGFDWDHIAAIGDITQSVPSRRRALGLATLYALGHAVVVFALGVVAIALGSKVPPSLDTFMSRFVGVTLIALGVYVLVAIVREGRDFRMRSRWMLIIRAGRRLARRGGGGDPVPVVVEHEHEHEPGEHHAHVDEPIGALARRDAAAARRHRHRHRHLVTMPDDPFLDYGAVSSTAIGMVHGIGAETPTQVLVLTTAAGVAGTSGGMIVLASFLAGLFCSNTAVAVASVLGLRRAEGSRTYLAISAAVAAASIAVGAIFVFGREGALPGLFV